MNNEGTVKLSPLKRFLFDVQQKWDEAADIYRDTPIRYLGYTNEVGEAFRALVPRALVTSSYVVATSYVIADAMDKGKRVHQNYIGRPSTRQRLVALSIFDALFWQGLASVIIPGITINRICALSALLFRRYSNTPSPMAKLSTTVIGLATIPFIVKPIDACVEVTMDKTLRQFYDVPRY